MIVAISVESGDGLCRVLLLVVVDEGESLALAGDLVLGQVDAGDVSERLEQLLQVALLRVLGQVGHSNSGRVVGWKIKTCSSIYAFSYNSENPLKNQTTGISLCEHLIDRIFFKRKYNGT